MALGSGAALALCFIAAQFKSQGWLPALLYAFAIVLAGVALLYSYRLMTAKGQVVVSIDSAGFKDTRLTPALIPWNAIRSVSPYKLPKSTAATGLAVAIDPAFKRILSIRPAAKFFNWANAFWGSEVYVDARVLDADCDEISRAAESHIAAKGSAKA